MQGFPDAVTLGAALVAMEEQPVPPGLETVTASLSVLAVLVQVRVYVACGLCCAD